ncbi:MAG: hypothetical protein FJ102_19805, partial [Deltaproteobacteria bacterium]|nr:hypothetical protein [Deltaproteobacteria bacterium]
GTNGVNAHAAFHGEAATGPLLVGPPRTLARLGRADVSAITGIDAGCLVACTDGTLARVGEGGVTARDRTSSRCVALVCTPSHVVALSAGSGHSVQGVSLHAPATLALLAQDATRSPLVALRLGDPHVLISVDDGGHPTDRCTWRYEWRPPAPVGPPEAIAQGNDVPDGPWTWTGPTWFRHDRPTTMLGAYLVEASDGRLRAHDTSKRCLLVLPLADVSALGVSPDGGTLYAGTTSGEVLAMTVTRGS